MCVTVLQRQCSLAILKWRNVKTWTTLSAFLRFFDMTLKKRKKSRFFNFQKKRKNVFSNYDPTQPNPSEISKSRPNPIQPMDGPGP